MPRQSLTALARSRAPRSSLSARPPLARMMRIHSLLESGRFPNCRHLAKEFEVSPKTVQRDIDFMRQQLELPIEYDSIKHGFGYAAPVHKFPMLSVSEGELVALLVAQKALAQYKGTAFERPLERAFLKMTSSLPLEASVSIRDLADAYSFAPATPARADLKVFETLSSAVLHRQEGEFSYKALDKAALEVRRVQPCHLRCVDNVWYLLAHDPARKGMRTFALPRMQRVKNLRRRFDLPAAFSLENMTRFSFGAFESGKPVKIRIKLNAIAARLIAERTVHKSQKLRPLPDGSAELSLEIALAPDFESWLLGFGPHIEVLAPASLRSRFQSATREMAAIYSQPSQQ